MSRYYNPEELGKDLLMDADKDLTYSAVKSVIYYPNSFSMYNLGSVMFHRIDGFMNMGVVVFMKNQGFTNLGVTIFHKEEEE